MPINRDAFERWDKASNRLEGRQRLLKRLLENYKEDNVLVKHQRSLIAETEAELDQIFKDLDG